MKVINCMISYNVPLVSPFGGVGTTKALSSTSLRGSVTSTLSPADTTSSLTVIENRTFNTKNSYLIENLTFNYKLNSEMDRINPQATNQYW